jgi:hypothetical protein
MNSQEWPCVPVHMECKTKESGVVRDCWTLMERQDTDNKTRRSRLTRCHFTLSRLDMAHAGHRLIPPRWTNHHRNLEIFARQTKIQLCPETYLECFRLLLLVAPQALMTMWVTSPLVVLARSPSCRVSVIFLCRSQSSIVGFLVIDLARGPTGCVHQGQCYDPGSDI